MKTLYHKKLPIAGLPPYKLELPIKPHDIATNEEEDQEFELKLSDFKKDKTSIVITSDDHKNGVV